MLLHIADPHIMQAYNLIVVFNYYYLPLFINREGY